MELRQGPSWRTDLEMTMGAVGMRGTLLRAGRKSGGLELAVRTDLLWTRIASAALRSPAGNLAAAEAKTSRVRLLLEVSRAVVLTGGVLTPVVEVGLRRDGGDAETGGGVEVGGRLGYASPWGLSFEASLRGLLAHEAKECEAWGASAALRFDSDRPGRGFMAAVVPSWGLPSAGVGRLWNRPETRGLAQAGGGAPSPAGRLEASRRNSVGAPAAHEVFLLTGIGW